MFGARSKARRDRSPSFLCPHCDAEVTAGSTACPECGSDESTGWKKDAPKWEADIPAGYGGDNDFDYDEFVRREFPEAGDVICGLPKRRFFCLLVTAGLALLLAFYLLR